ncbi:MULTISPECIES: hypothetical protein [Cobetia]|uniref:hypothetical protein n=1 Tax=Cobetia TaxID=204286 RepID=UPI0015833493|nr:MULTISPECIES: hypothetical protein [Cobetia]MDI4659578.1 hypothetical protein [Cobetia sp. BMC6]NUJ56127.1 hypothetical protein [Cobetia marina]
MANESLKGGHKNAIPFRRQFFASLMGVSFMLLSGFLLYTPVEFEGGAAVTLVIVGFFCSVLYLVFPYIRAISIGSYVIEFHEVQELMEEINQLKVEASEMLGSIKSARMNSYRNLLLQLDVNSEMKKSISLGTTHKVNLLNNLLSSMESEGVLNDLSSQSSFILKFVHQEHMDNMLDAYYASGVKVPDEHQDSFADTMQFVVDELRSRNDQPSLLIYLKLQSALTAYYRLTQWDEKLKSNQ